MQLLEHFFIESCPHCGMNKPNLKSAAEFHTAGSNGVERFWRAYYCAACGGVITASAENKDGKLLEYFPRRASVSDDLPELAKAYLQQALDSQHAPSGSIMLSASSIDAMLKEKLYIEGSLYSRINSAASDHLITESMKDWAHKVRLDANAQRHADEEAKLPDIDDAKNTFEFASALGEFLFVLPARVNRGIVSSDLAEREVPAE